MGRGLGFRKELGGAQGEVGVKAVPSVPRTARLLMGRVEGALRVLCPPPPRPHSTRPRRRGQPSSRGWVAEAWPVGTALAIVMTVVVLSMDRGRLSSRRPFRKDWAQTGHGRPSKVAAVGCGSGVLRVWFAGPSPRRSRRSQERGCQSLL